MYMDILPVLNSNRSAQAIKIREKNHIVPLLFLLLFCTINVWIECYYVKMNHSKLSDWLISNILEHSWWSNSFSFNDTMYL